jgi:hypothetical protein
MFPSRVHSLLVPRIDTTLAGVTGNPPSPATLVKDAGHDCIVVVLNNSFGQFVLLALDPAVLQTDNPRADTFKLPAGMLHRIILARGQSLYASTTSGPPEGAGAEISFHVYESVPIDATI